MDNFYYQITIKITVSYMNDKKNVRICMIFLNNIETTNFFYGIGVELVTFYL